MRRSAFIAALAASFLSLAGSAFAATASNSQNGTDSSNANATSGPPTSTSAVPATGMQMGTQPGTVPMQNGGAMAPDGSMSTGSGMTAVPKQ